jgi:hypothetical protein
MTRSVRTRARPGLLGARRSELCLHPTGKVTGGDPRRFGRRAPQFWALSNPQWPGSRTIADQPAPSPMRLFSTRGWCQGVIRTVSGATVRLVQHHFTPVADDSALGRRCRRSRWSCALDGRW